jgi:misacylated tRNA(Ala) deacylase
MKHPLYLLNCYLKEFEAVVANVSPDGLEIILDQTAFYPTSGGQPNDLGIINLIDVMKRDGLIVHKIDKPGLNAADKVHCVIDWERRYTLMRYHTASHILSTVINKETCAEITGNQLYLDKARVDFSLENFDRVLMNGFQDKANGIIAKNLPVTFRMLEREEAFKIPALVKLRKQLPETIQEIRVVDVASPEYDFDHQACGGTHLRNTSEIGRIEIYNLENKGKERRRIYFRIMAS